MQTVDSPSQVDYSLYTDKGINFAALREMDTPFVLSLAQAEAKKRRRASLYLADLIVYISDNMLMYHGSLVHKDDLAIEFQIEMNSRIFPNVLTPGGERFFARLNTEFRSLTPEQIAERFPKHCKALSAKDLSNLLEVKLQTVYNSRHIMRKYPLAQRPNDPQGWLGFSHYQDVTRPNLSQVDSLNLLQEYLDAKARGFYFSDDPDTLIEATPSELENRAIALNALRKEQYWNENARPKNLDPLPHTVDTRPHLKVLRGTQNMSKHDAQQIAFSFGKNGEFINVPDDTKINVQVTFYYEVNK